MMTAVPIGDLLAWFLLHLLWQGAVLWVLHRVLHPRVSARSARAAAALSGGVLCAAFLLPALALLGAITRAGALPPAERGAAISTLHAAVLDTSGQVGSLFDRAGPVLHLLVIVWVCGVLLGGWRLARSVVAARRLVRNAAPVAASGPVAGVDLVVSTAFGPREIALREAHELDTPMVIGWRSPAILLPVTIARALAPGELRALLLHERAHVRRRDYAVHLCQRVLAVLTWPSPAVRPAMRALRLERERCCDADAVREGAAPVTLTRALLRLEETRLSSVSLGMAAASSPLRQRIHALLRVEPEARRSALLPALLACALIAVPSLAVTIAAPSESVRLARGAARAGDAAGPTMQVSAEDPAGRFTLDIANGRIAEATVAGTRIPRHRLRQAGDSIRVHGADGRVLVSVELDPAGAVRWRARSGR